MSMPYTIRAPFVNHCSMRPRNNEHTYSELDNFFVCVMGSLPQIKTQETRHASRGRQHISTTRMVATQAHAAHFGRDDHANQIKRWSVQRLTEALLGRP
jgi:hypothetical protein